LVVVVVVVVLHSFVGDQRGSVNERDKQNAD